MTITIKTAYDQKGEQYWFAENQEGDLFGITKEGKTCFKDKFFERKDENLSGLGMIMCSNWRFKSLKELQNNLKKHCENLEKFNKEPEVVETFEL